MQGAQTAGQGLGTMGQAFGQLGMTGQRGLMNQIGAFNQMGQTGRNIQNQMYGAQFDAANKMAQEPWKRMQAWGQMMQPMMPPTMAGSQWGQPESPFDPYKALSEMFGWNIPGGTGST